MNRTSCWRTNTHCGSEQSAAQGNWVWICSENHYRRTCSSKTSTVCILGLLSSTAACDSKETNTTNLIGESIVKKVWLFGKQKKIGSERVSTAVIHLHPSDRSPQQPTCCPMEIYLGTTRASDFQNWKQKEIRVNSCSRTKKSEAHQAINFCDPSDSIWHDVEEIPLERGSCLSPKNLKESSPRARRTP